METIMSIWAFFHSDAGIALLVALFAISEALAYIPAIKSNSILQAVQAGLKKAIEAVKKKDQVE